MSSKQPVNLLEEKLIQILQYARDENTSPQVLQEIYQHRQSYLINPKYFTSIMFALTSNPNTPIDALLTLGNYCPTQLLQNPVFDLYLLSDPNLLAKIPLETISRIAQLSQAPRGLILYTLKHRRTTELSKLIICHHTQVWKQWRKDNEDIILDLSTIRLQNTNLEGVNLRSTNLRNSNLQGSNLRNVDLRGADLSGINLKGVDLSGANLKGVDLTGVYLRGVALTEETIIESKWRLVWRISNYIHHGFDLEGVDLSGADLSFSVLPSARLASANLRGVNLRGANLQGADLTGADLTDANLFTANLQGADLTGADLTDANLGAIALNAKTKINQKWLINPKKT